MSLPAIVLDDFTWQETVDAVRAQIAAVSAEEWTLHAAVDPGVTLIELLAYLLEQRVYWLDQMSDSLLLALVALLGAEPRAARPSLTLMELANSAPGVQDLAEEEPIERRERVSTFHFRARSATAIVPVERISLVTPFGTRDTVRAGTPRWSMKPVSLLAADGGASEFSIGFWMPDTAAAALPAQPVTLLLDMMDAPGAIAPQWSYDAVREVRPPAVLQFRYSVAGGGRKELPAASLRDGTQGLRRSGVVAFEMPTDWAPSGPPENGVLPYTVWCSTERATFAAPPRATRLAPNVALAANECQRSVDAQEVRAQLARWLPLPALRLQLPNPALPLEGSMRLRIRERNGEWHEWQPAFDLTRCGPGDRVFLVDRPHRRLVFGDGLTGRVPVPDHGAEPALTLDYLGGGGEAANLGANLLWTIPTLPAVSATNVVPARGGLESESAEMVRSRVAAALQIPQRAVTAADFRTLAIGTPGVAVARAYAAVGRHPGFPCTVTPGAVTVFIVPAVPRGADAVAERWVSAPQPDPGMLAEVSLRLDERRLITQEVFVRGPVYRRVTVELIIARDPGSDSDLRVRLTQGLTRYLDPLIGGESGDGWPFGNPLRPSELAGQVERVLGEQATLQHLMLRLADDGLSSDCTDIAIAAHELVWLETLTIEWRADAARRGGLR